MAKGHMRRLCQGIRSTRNHTNDSTPLPIKPDALDVNHGMAPSVHSESSRLSINIAIAPHPREATLIEPDDDDYEANIFCFVAFVDKHTGVLYSDLTRSFPFMSLKGNVCFLIVYHYKTNAILALPIADFTDNSTLAAYIKQFELLESKGYKIKLNVMDNQACCVIKNYLVSKQCNPMLVKPNNHQVNAAEHAIQMFKVHFISALATTDSKFSIQLCDRLTNQVETTLNMLCPSRINPSMSAYKTVHGPYNWNRFPLAPPECKAVIYEVPKRRGSWTSRGADAWYIGPLMDHYRCNHYFVPKTISCRMSGKAEIFLQHCQVPFLMWNEHPQEVIDELVTTL